MDTLLLASYALAFAIRNGKVWFITDHLQRFSFFRSMFACVLCTGTEVGLWMHFFLRAPSDIFTVHGAFGHFIDSVIFGLSAGGFCLVVEVLLDAAATYIDKHGDTD